MIPRQTAGARNHNVGLSAQRWSEYLRCQGASLSECSHEIACEGPFDSSIWTFQEMDCKINARSLRGTNESFVRGIS
jgi:hypothetical protein